MQLLLERAAGRDGPHLVYLWAVHLELAVRRGGAELGVAVALARGVRHLAVHHPSRVKVGGGFARGEEVAVTAAQDEGASQHRAV